MQYTAQDALFMAARYSRATHPWAGLSPKYSHFILPLRSEETEDD